MKDNKLINSIYNVHLKFYVKSLHRSNERMLDYFNLILAPLIYRMTLM